MARGKLNPRQLKFVLFFVRTGNASLAAREAGYSAQTAEQQGCVLLRNPKVAAEITKRQGQVATRLEISTERLATEMARLAFFDPRRLIGPDGMLRRIEDLDSDTAAAISSIEVVTRPMPNVPAGRLEQVTKLRFHSKNGALQNLARLMGARGFRPGALDLPAPPDNSGVAGARLALAELLADAEPDVLVQMRETVETLKALERKRAEQTIDGDADEIDDETQRRD